MTNQTTWQFYTGSDEQIIELQTAEHGFIIKNIYGHLWKEIYFFWHQCPIGSSHYWIIPDDPLREMKVRQAMTGQEVWIKMYLSELPKWIKVLEVSEYREIASKGLVVFSTTQPFWNIPNANYSFSPFQE